jgi:hypothetical protein
MTSSLISYDRLVFVRSRVQISVRSLIVQIMFQRNFPLLFLKSAGQYSERTIEWIQWPLQLLFNLIVFYKDCICLDVYVPK